MAGTQHYLTRTQLALLTIASAAVTANAYYIHPIIARVAEDFAPFNLNVTRFCLR